jgi:anaerobic magnesium-protoporphyrin IX monomethyl ester cyclase
MRIVFVHPNYHSGGRRDCRQLAAGLGGLSGRHLKRQGLRRHPLHRRDDRWTCPEDLARRMVELKPDAVGVTSITPSIYKAEEVLKIASEVVPDAVRVLGGVHATFMFKQVLTEAPWVDVIVRGEGEEIMVALMSAVRDGAGPPTAARSRASPSAMAKRSSPPQAAATVKDLDHQARTGR